MLLNSSVLTKLQPSENMLVSLHGSISLISKIACLMHIGDTDDRCLREAEMHGLHCRRQFGQTQRCRDSIIERGTQDAININSDEVLPF